MPAVELEAITFSYPGGPRALEDVQPSGRAQRVCGYHGAEWRRKNHANKMINGFIASDKGQVRLEGEGYPPYFPRQRCRAKFGFVFQDPAHPKFFWMLWRGGGSFGPQKIG